MICTRLLNYQLIACRQTLVFVGRTNICGANNSKILSPIVLKRNLYESPVCPPKKPPAPCVPPCPPPKNDTTLKYILGALAAIGLGGLAWCLLTRGGDKDDDKDKQPPLMSSRIPANSSDLPKQVPYLLVGGGAASFSAFRAIKSNDPKAKVLVITKDMFKPYMRPPLSKELWYSAQPGVIPKDFRFKQYNGTERSIFFEPDEFYVDPVKLSDTVNGGIAVAHGYTVKKIDPKQRVATLDDGTEIQYGKCLIATGSSPKNLPCFENAPKFVQDRILNYKTPQDFIKLKNFMDEKKSVVVVGSGFTGSELTCALATYAKQYSKDSNVKIVQIYQESGNMSRTLPEYLSKWTTSKVEELGVCVVPGVQVKEVLQEQSKLKLVLSNGQSILTDVAVVCVGCEANTGFADVSGLEVDGDCGGLVVNAELEARQDLFAAGDVACFYDSLLGRRRLERHDNSINTGRLAGENMVGKEKKPYEHQSMFFADLGPGIGYEGIGKTEAALPTVGVFALKSEDKEKQPKASGSTEETKQPHVEQKQDSDSSQDTNEPEEYTKGVIFYMKNGKIVGIVLWNLFNRIGLARTIINENKAYDDLNEVAKLFEIHS